MGHIHLTVPDPDAQLKVWTDVLGGQPVKAGPLSMVKFPGIFIIVAKANATEGSNGSTVNHIGFLVKSYADLKAKLAAAHIESVLDNEKNKQIIANFPDNVRVEFFEDASLSVPITFHHIHLASTEPEALRDWYVKTFGGEATQRRIYPGAKIPGGEVDVQKVDSPAAPTKGRTLDHIGFEVQDLEAFTKKLEADGVKFDSPLRDVPAIGLKIAFVFDPVGTRIELTQGLAGR